MAEVMVSEILIVLFEKLTSEGVKKIVRSWGIQSEIKKLERILLQIQALLNDASEKEVTNEAVKLWLNGLQHLAYDIDDILDGLATEAMHREFNEESVGSTCKVKIPTWFTNFSLSNRMGRKLDDITAKLEDLEKEKTRLGLVVKEDRPKNINRKYQTSVVDVSSIVGRQVEKEELVCKLLNGEPPCDKRFSVVPIVGMGGVGKTTLARLLYNDNQVKDHFDLKAWVCVSDDFDSFGISKVIFQSVAGENKEFADLNLLQVDLKNLLTGKRFLLVLDDVWSESYDDWETLVTPFHACAPGSKIILTTRKEQLLNKIGCIDQLQLQSLSHDDAVTLLAQNAFGLLNFDSYPALKPHAEGIVEKCDGLPLALKALGRLLRTKENKEEYWYDVLNSEIWRLKDEGGIVPALRLSYHDLSACLKRLFAYCSFFPKDYLFDKRELVLLWMAEGFLHHSTPNISTEEHFGDNCFEELLSSSFFQPASKDGTTFIMHDLMNDLAISIAGEFFVRLDNKMEKDKGSERLGKCRHMSFVRERYVTYNKCEEAFIRAGSLRTLLAISDGVTDILQSFYLSNKILVNLLPKLTFVRVLNLSNFEISEVPDTIGSLRHLRYLNLSRTIITQLPESVCNLYNLQTLILFGCYRLVKLPKNFLKLKNLRHLDIRNTPNLNKMPLGIGKLNSLQTLSKIILGGENGLGITELKELNNVCGEISIEGLDKVQNASDVREANFFQKRLSKLDLIWSDVIDGSRNSLLDKDVLVGLKPHYDTLKQLKTASYRGTEIPSWVVDPSYNRLSHVSIRGCNKCTSLPPLGQLMSLEELFIEGMDEVNNVGVEFFGTGVVSFPVLKILSFENMKGWKLWSTKSGIVYPCLEKLVIKRCPNLVEVSIEALVSLRQLEVNGCGHNVLTSMVQAASSVTELKIESISGLTDEVWRGVVEHLRAVEELSIWRCDEIRYLWESEAKASTFFASLRMLVVQRCYNLVSLGEKEEDDKSGSNLLTSLRILQIQECKRMVHCSCPNNIETLCVLYCESLTDVSFSSRGGGQMLKSLSILDYKGGDMSQMLINTNNKGMPLLQHVDIKRFPNMKFIHQLNYFLHLTSLKIYDCESPESFQDVQLPNLTSLTELAICKCPKMDGSFPRGLWPPKLKILTIGKLKKPISEWGPQNFPPSLVQLYLSGNDDESISDNQLSRLLPSSLTSLYIGEFKELETMGLQHLNSLQYLSISNCQKMKDVLLPSSLTSLLIYQLKEFETISIGLRHLTSLQHLLIKDCPKMKDLLLPSSLTSLSIDGLKELETISLGPQYLITSLQHLSIEDCGKLKDLPEMLFPSLLSLSIYQCPELKKRCSRSKIKIRSRREYLKNYWPLISHIPKIQIDNELQ